MADTENATPDFLFDYGPAELAARHDGWTAERQRRFLTILAETGHVTHAAQAAGVTPRSAYRLRHHKKGRAFRAMWDRALYLASDRLTSLAFERAIEGTPQQVWKDGELVAETRRPSDRLLIFLLGHLRPTRFGPQDAQRAAWDDSELQARRTFPRMLDMIADADVPLDPDTADPAPTLAHPRVEP